MIRFETPVALDSLFYALEESLANIEIRIAQLKELIQKHDETVKEQEKKQSILKRFITSATSDYRFDETLEEYYFNLSITKDHRTRLISILNSLKLRPSSISINKEDAFIINLYKNL